MGHRKIDHLRPNDVDGAHGEEDRKGAALLLSMSEKDLKGVVEEIAEDNGDDTHTDRMRNSETTKIWNMFGAGAGRRASREADLGTERLVGKKSRRIRILQDTDDGEGVPTGRVQDRIHPGAIRDAELSVMMKTLRGVLIRNLPRDLLQYTMIRLDTFAGVKGRFWPIDTRSFVT